MGLEVLDFLLEIGDGFPNDLGVHLVVVGELRDTVVKTFGRIYSEFLPTKRSNVQEIGVREAHEVPTRQGARPPPSWTPCVLSGLVLIFYFSKYSKIEKNCH